MALRLWSEAFGEGERIPQRYTCEGADLSPPLAWSGAPEGTGAWALVVHDPDAPVGDWVHWVLYDLPGSVTTLPEGVPTTGVLSSGAKQGMNDFRRLGYGGPCPPRGHGPHRYIFELFALDAPTGLKAGATRSELLAAIDGHVLGRGRLVGTYERR
ncbi:MAG: YbhB/YbcL family Raf kinase inhibitor-like protein [Planctomycetota bacterium]|nr:MAG: YbhB/YbcL family Raf kinase inhibitor-like protein [Planctomycetota bacterium]